MDDKKSKYKVSDWVSVWDEKSHGMLWPFQINEVLQKKKYRVTGYGYGGTSERIFNEKLLHKWIPRNGEIVKLIAKPAVVSGIFINDILGMIVENSSTDALSIEYKTDNIYMDTFKISEIEPILYDIPYGAFTDEEPEAKVAIKIGHETFAYGWAKYSELIDPTLENLYGKALNRALRVADEIRRYVEDLFDAFETE
jgi:hypothetical protein